MRRSAAAREPLSSRITRRSRFLARRAAGAHAQHAPTDVAARQRRALAEAGEDAHAPPIRRVRRAVARAAPRCGDASRACRDAEPRAAAAQHVGSSSPRRARARRLYRSRRESAHPPRAEAIKSPATAPSDCGSRPPRRRAEEHDARRRPTASRLRNTRRVVRCVGDARAHALPHVFAAARARASRRQRSRARERGTRPVRGGRRRRRRRAAARSGPRAARRTATATRERDVRTRRLAPGSSATRRAAADGREPRQSAPTRRLDAGEERRAALERQAPARPRAWTRKSAEPSIAPPARADAVR